MMNPDDIKRVQTAVGSQQSGNDIVGTIGLKGGFACSDTGGLVGSPVGPFMVVPQTGANQGCYRVYPNFPAHSIKSIDHFNVSGFTPRNPTVAETAAAMVTGYGIDAANKKWYITVQIATLGTWAILTTPPENFVVGVEVAVTFNSNANPL